MNDFPLDNYPKNITGAPIEAVSKSAKIKTFLKFFSYLVVFVLVAGVIFSTQAMLTGKKEDVWFNKLPIVKQLRRLAESADRKLKGEDKDRINILLLGIGGKNHEGGLLTDTIMLASLKPSTKEVSLISIPRDMTIPVEGYGWRKVNSINAYAEMSNPGSGGLAISQALSNVFDEPIDYYFTVDFDGFAKIIDDLGGIDVNVENTFDDYAYPIRGREEAYPYESRFEHLHIESGWQHMNGDLALKYARSRHAYGVEGSDFARAKRQQNIIEAVKTRALSSYLIFRPTKISDIINDLSDHLNTNLKIWEMARLWDIFKDVKKENIINRVLDNGPGGLLVDARGDDGAYILVPRSGNFTEIKYLVNSVFGDVPSETKTKIITEQATVAVLNGTWVNGLASQAALDLEKYGFTINFIGNNSERNSQRSVIYDFSAGTKLESLKALKEKTGANVSMHIPEWLRNEIKDKISSGQMTGEPNFVLILGQDADPSSSGTENKYE